MSTQVKDDVVSRRQQLLSEIFNILDWHLQLQEVYNGETSAGSCIAGPRKVGDVLFVTTEGKPLVVLSQSEDGIRLP